MVFQECVCNILTEIQKSSEVSINGMSYQKIQKKKKNEKDNKKIHKCLSPKHCCLPWKTSHTSYLRFNTQRELHIAEQFKKRF